MTVTCPECATRFRDPPAEILAARKMQCGKCNHEWFANEHLAAQDTATHVPEIDKLVGQDDAIHTALPVVVAQDAPPVVCETTAAIYVDHLPKPKAKRSAHPYIAAFGLACLGLSIAAVGLRAEVMKAAPQTVALYQSIGLATDNPSLRLANITTTRSKRDGISQLIVRGEVANIADATVPVPPLRLIMRGQSNHSLYAWTVTASKQALKAGETSRFTAIAKDVPDDAVNVEVKFAVPKTKRR